MAEINKAPGGGKRAQPKQDDELSVDLFRPQDAKGVGDVFRAIYGEDYPVRIYYEPEALTEANRTGRIISSVARTGKGRVVGHTALFQNAPHAKVYESGAGAVLPEYRGHKLFEKMGLHGIQTGAPLHGVENVFVEPVLNHLLSQKVLARLGWCFTALEFDLMPAEAYEMEKTAQGRVSTILGFKSLVARPHTVYLPPVYETQLRYLYEHLDEHRDLAPAPPVLPPRGLETRIESLIYPQAGVARMRIHQAGPDFCARLRQEERALAGKGVVVFQAHLSLGKSHVAWAVDQLRARGWFFGGLLPRWFDVDGLFMQRMAHHPNFEDIVLLDHHHFQAILEMVRRDWERTQR